VGVMAPGITTALYRWAEMNEVEVRDGPDDELCPCQNAALPAPIENRAAPMRSHLLYFFVRSFDHVDGALNAHRDFNKRVTSFLPDRIRHIDGFLTDVTRMTGSTPPKPSIQYFSSISIIVLLWPK